MFTSNSAFGAVASKHAGSKYQEFNNEVTWRLSEADPPQLVVPVVNVTEIESLLLPSSQIKGFVPRWIGVGNLSREAPGGEEIEIEAVFELGDSEKENSLGLAQGFPKVNLRPGQAIISHAYSRFFQAGGPPVTSLNLTFDILGLFMDMRREDEVKGLLFSDLQANEAAKGKNRGERVLEYLSLPPELSVGDALRMKPIRNLARDLSDKDLQALGVTRSTRVADLLNDVLRLLKPSDFIFRNEYEIAATYDKPRGKWAEVMTGTVFIDSTEFFDIYSYKLLKRILQIMARDLRREKDKEVMKLKLQRYLLYQSSAAALGKAINQTDPQTYAFSAIGVGSDSLRQYRANPRWPQVFLNDAYQSKHTRHTLESQYAAKTPLTEQLTVKQPVNSGVTNFLVMQIMNVLFLAYVVINSLFDNEIKDKTFENAMLRCLGWNLSQVGLIQVMQVQLFHAVPATVGGLALTYAMCVATKTWAEYSLQREVVLDFTWDAVIVGSLVGTVLPLIALIQPAVNSFSQQLLDSLNVHKRAPPQSDIMITKLSDKYGLSPTQLVAALLLTGFGSIIFIVVPYELMQKNLARAGLFLLAVYVVCGFALALVAQLLLPSLQKAIVSTYVFLFPSSRKFRPVLKVNIQSNRIRNMNVGLTFICISSTLFQNSTLAVEMKQLLAASMERYVGGDLTVLTPMAATRSMLVKPLDEDRLTEKLRALQKEHAYVKHFGFSSFPLDAILGLSEEAVTLENDYKRIEISVVAVQENHLRSSNQDRYKVSSVMDFGAAPGQEEDIVKVLYDVCQAFPYTYYMKRHDPFDVLSFQGEAQQAAEPQQIINLLLPTGLRQTLDIQVGRPHLRLCLGKGRCFRARAVGLVDTFPGVPNFSRYYYISFAQPNAVITEDQMRYLMFEYFQRPARGVPQRALYINLDKGVTPEQTLKLTSLLQSEVDSQSVFVINTNQLLKLAGEQLDYLVMFFLALSFLLTVLGVQQLFLSVQSTLRDNQSQIGIYRAIGMKNAQLRHMFQLETGCLLLAALALGLVKGALLVHVCRLSFDALWEVSHPH